MDNLPLLKLVEVLGVAVAGGAFVWWQLRDVTRAQEASRRTREAREAREALQARDALVALDAEGTPATAQAPQTSTAPSAPHPSNTLGAAAPPSTPPSTR